MTPSLRRSADSLINDLHAFQLGLGGVTAPADEELVDVDDPDR